MSDCIDRIELRHVRMRLKSDFRTSFGLERDRECILICVYSGGERGWGECVAGAEPGYSYETVGTAWHVLKDFFVPALFEHDAKTPRMLVEALGRYRGHPLARTGLEMALWDLRGKLEGSSFQEMIGGSRKRVAVGVSIGIQADARSMLEKITEYLQQGYRRIKIKIAPGADLQILKSVRKVYPDQEIWVDANAAYSLDDLETLRKFDAFGLGLIEQPLYEDDLVEHAELQKQLTTDICLDESIHHMRDAQNALKLGACRIVNIKPARVGGYLAAADIENFCRQKGVPVWCGGMLETGIGRAANLAIASRAGFSLPGDISASDRYYERDICDPRFNLNEDSTIDVPTSPGLGVRVEENTIEDVTLREIVLTRSGATVSDR